jgi:hypothetical protein
VARFRCVSGAGERKGHIARESAWDESETPHRDRGFSQDGTREAGVRGVTVTEEMQAIITGVAAATGRGADALRRSGIGVELEDFRVEVQVDAADPSPALVVTMVLGSTRPGAG